MRLRRLADWITRVLGSRYFFYGTLAFFVLEALWIALSAVYPMAFDEDFHLGIITIYSHHWSPFLSTQPAGADMFDAVHRDPSYLYHYLMSFPLRLVGTVTDSQTAQIISLRLINIGLFAAGIVIFRKVLLAARCSAAFTNTALAIFVLVPMVPLLAAHINYDNLGFLLLAWMCLLTVQSSMAFTEKRVALRPLLTLCIVGATAGLVKFETLPIFALMLIFLAAYGTKVWWGAWPKLWRACVAAWIALGRRTQVVLCLILLVVLGLFVQRYGVNFVQYHTPNPPCDKVLSEERCMAYGPWARNHFFEETKTGDVDGPISYTLLWVQALHYRSFFAVAGAPTSYQNFPPLPVPSAAAVVIFVMGVIAIVLAWRYVFSQPVLLLFLLLSVGYCAALWLFDTYPQYVQTGQPVAINGRYLVPILLPMAAVFGQALSLVLRPVAWLKSLLAALAIVAFLQGGGVCTFILRSEPVWLWPNGGVRTINMRAYQVLSHVVITSGKSYN